MWRPDDPQGNESEKVRWELVRWTRGRGLDIGCGPWKAFRHFIGIDSTDYGGPSGPNILGDCMHLDMFAEGSMDFVFSSHLLEHVVDYRAALAHWWSKVRVGGYLVLYLPHAQYYPNIGMPGANPDHKHDFIPDDIKKAMEMLAPDWDMMDNQVRKDGREYSFFQVYKKLSPGEGHRATYAYPRPQKKAAVVRYGAHGDALWAASVLPHLKKQGYHVTVYTQEAGEFVLRNDPHIDDIIIQSDYQVDGTALLQYWHWESQKYDKWVNLVGSVETRLLPQPADLPFYWPDELRQKLMNQNYLEAVHDFAGVPQEYHQKFYPTAEEVAWAMAERAKYDGPVVVVNPSGSSIPKWWPHTNSFMRQMAEREIHTVVLGDLRGMEFVEPKSYGHVIGLAWSIRQVMAFCQVSDVVVGVESAIVNSVAFESNLKIVLLSHSSVENLTKHWTNTISLEPTGLECYPCHRVHLMWHFCTREKQTGLAVCQAAAFADKVAVLVSKYIEIHKVA